MKDHYGIISILTGFERARNEGELYEQLERCCHDLGFTYFAIGHHVNLKGPPMDAVGLTNYDPRWIERSLHHEFFRDDPVHRASTKAGAGFMWSSIPKMIRLTPRQELILRIAREYGLEEGFTIPITVPGDYRGTCSFSSRSNNHIHPIVMLFAQSLGAFAFEAVRRIIKERSRVPASYDEIPRLSERERDTLVLLGRGNTDAEVGQQLGIAKATAHNHIEHVRRAYGNAQRPFLIARALFDGQISFGELFRR